MSDISSGDDERRMQFATDTDFEGGQWINGEFFYSKKKGGRQQTEEDRLYGVFQDQSSGDSDGSGGGYKRAKKPRKGTGLGASSSRSRDINFVPSSATAAVATENRPTQQKPSTPDAAEFEEHEDVSANNLVKDIIRETKAEPAPAASNKNNDSFREMLQQQAAQEKAKEELKQKRLNAVPLNDLGKWEKHTKGVGRKLLDKFGFKGRLGANEDGISAAVEVKVRPNTMGLGFGDFVEASALEANKKLEAELKKEEYIPKKPEAKAPLKGQEDEFSVEKRAASQSWKKGKTGPGVGDKRKRHKSKDVIFQDAMELMKNGNATDRPQSSLFVDMRGPTPKVVAELKDINMGILPDVAAMPENVRPALGQELLYNINMMVDTTQLELDKESRRYRQVVTRCTDLTEQKERLSCLINKDETKVDRLKKIHLILGRIEQKVEEGDSDINARDIFKAFKSLKSEFPIEYNLLGITELVPHICRLMESKHFGDAWNPLADPSLIASVFSTWFSGCSDLEHDAIDAEENQVLSSSSISPTLMRLVEELCIFKIRRCLATEWAPKINPEVAVLLIGSLHDATVEYVSIDAYKSLLSYSILPRLKAEVERWNPTVDPVPIHCWLHPWLPLLRSELSEVYPDIRRKLGKALTNWSPEDESALIIIQPWSGVFDGSSMDNLLQRAIVPKLVSATRALTLDPQNATTEHTELFSSILAWYKLVPSLHMVSMLEGEFFPRWLQILSFWLSTEHADLSEITQWYLGWKSLFPDEMLANDRITSYFNHALELMQHSLSGGTGGGMNILPPGIVASGSYFEVVERRKAEIAAIKRLRDLRNEETGKSNVHHTPSTSTRGHSVSFKDVVEEFALRNGITFLPRTGRLQEGKQVFQFGKLSCYLDQGVAFMLRKKSTGKSSWDPVSLDEMLSFA